MNSKSFQHTSLSRQFGFLMGSFFLFFVIGIAVLLTAFHYINKTFMDENEKLEAKNKLEQEITNDFNQAFFDFRGFIAYKNISMRDQAVSLGPKIKSLTNQYEKIASTDDDRRFLTEIREFTSYYFDDTLPAIIRKYESRSSKEVNAAAGKQLSPKVVQFQKKLMNALQKQDQNLENHFKKLIKIETDIQIGFAVFILLILFILIRLLGFMFKLIGRPLSQLADAANQIAKGKDANLSLNANRDDEIGVLSASFQRMAEKVREKEQDLVTQNDKLASLFRNSEEERTRNQVILDTLQEGVQFVDKQGTTLQVNDYLCKMFQCGSVSLIGLPRQEWIIQMEEFVKNRELSSFLNTSLGDSEDSAIEDRSFVYKMKNTFRVIKVYSQGIYNNKEKIGTIFVHRDITKEFEVNKIKSEFVSTVSHELRTPLSSILGFTELMLNRELTPERQKKYLSTILNEAKRLTALINDFLDVQRMEAGKQIYEKRYIHLLPIMNKVIEARQILTEVHQFILTSSTANPLIFGDPVKIEQVFTNLISNAVKYSPDGGSIMIQIKENPENVEIDVIDEGLGIPNDAIDKLFDKFYRVDNTDRRRIGGTGLGLSIVKEIVKAHNGEISVQSEYGKGSTFTVVFPVIGTARQIFIPKNK